MATSLNHYAWSMVCYRMLKHRFRGCRELLIACDMLVFYKWGEDEIALAPDVFVSFGVPPGPRSSYFVQREGKPPDVVLEFASPSTVRKDAGEKKEKYRQMGVPEYWLVDPVGGYHDPQVQGFQLLDGEYERMAWEEGPDGLVAVWSPLLQMEVRFADGQLRFWDRKRARYLELPEEEAEARVASKERARQKAVALQQEAEARVASKERARQKAVAQIERMEQALKAEKRARKALEARLAKFEAESRSTRDPT